METGDLISKINFYLRVNDSTYTGPKQRKRFPGFANADHPPDV